jgi:hypothetical protein
MQPDIANLIGIAHRDMDCWRLGEQLYQMEHRTLPPFDDIGADETQRISLQVMNNTSEADAGVGRFKRINCPEYLDIVIIKNHPVYTAHIGFYLENGLFIHSLVDAGVVISKITEPRWKKKIKGYYRLR